jgi:hypothetical protein
VTEAYPLQWPAGRGRRLTRKDGRFSAKKAVYRNGNSWTETTNVTVAEALKRLQGELDRIGARYAVISSNLETRLDGLPRSGQSEPTDPGVAVYFQLDQKPHCLPCDTYNRVAQNIAAVAAHIKATRDIERHGVASVAEMFAGFEALPSPDMVRPWRQVLELHREPHVTLATVEAAFRRLAQERHPDRGGSDAMMAELNVARTAAQQELRP